MLEDYLLKPVIENFKFKNQKSLLKEEAKDEENGDKDSFLEMLSQNSLLDDIKPCNEQEQDVVFDAKYEEPSENDNIEVSANGPGQPVEVVEKVKPSFAN